MEDAWDEVSAELRSFRDLVGDPAIQAQLMSDPAAWDTLCAAIDAVDDRRDPAGKLSAVNALRQAVGFKRLEDAEPEQEAAAVFAGTSKWSPAVRTAAPISSTTRCTSSPGPASSANQADRILATLTS